jgi:cytochrome b6
MGSVASSARRWFEERFGPDPLAPLRKKQVPLHRHTVWYYLGGMTLFLFFIQVATGILLLLYYRASPGEAFESVQFIMTKVQFGWLIRGLHAWAANLLILIAMLHMFSTFFLKAYRKPRELTWVTGCILFFLFLGFGFSGYLLPWNELAFFATKVGTEMMAAVPVIGGWLLTLFRGGEEVTGATLTRFFGFHVAVFPALTTLVIAAHLLLVQHLGMSVPPKVEANYRGSSHSPATQPFFPNFLLRDLIGWYIALGVLAALAALDPWELGVKADPFAPTPAGIKPEWYFLFLFETLKLLPAKLLWIEGEQFGVLVFAVAAGLWVLVPFLDRNPEGRSGRIFTALGVCRSGGGEGKTMHLRVVPAVFLALVGVAGLVPAALAQEEPAKPIDSCLDCHSLLEDQATRDFVNDIHHARALGCAGCHGGDPTAEDMPAAMNPAKGFIGVPTRRQIPQLCAHCHSDGAFMRAYNPSLRTDQLAQYRTSIHGRRLRQGDTKVAVCTDCHGVHVIRPASSPRSQVHPLALPETCARCHSNSDYMNPYEIATDQLNEYGTSVHFRTLEGGDLSAPTCATCHGNHGAAPPGVASVERVCGTCHVFQEQLFDQSPHKSAWEELGLATCITCHSNHRIEPTSDALTGVGEEALCVTCHLEDDPGWETAEHIHGALTQLDAALQDAAAILDRAERAGMEVGEARVIQANAQEQLIKARVEVHAFSAARVEETTENGLEFSRQAHQAGQEALAELAFRRKGLALSLVIIVLVVLSLWLVIRRLERRKPPAQSASGP